MKRLFLIQIILLAFFTSCAQQTEDKKVRTSKNMEKFEVNKSDEEWRKLLTPLQFNVLRKKGTERPYSGEYDTLFAEGRYYCAGCNAELFTSYEKYNSGCGWPAFYDKATNNNIIEIIDKSHGMIRTEVLCAKCGGHLGHVFNDGPEPTGLRYCINSASMTFKPFAEAE